jgi:bilirubin oxidase
MKRKSIVLAALLAALTVIGIAPAVFAQAPLDPASVPQFVTPLFIPGTMPKITNPTLPNTDYYEIAVRQFTQQILPTTGFGPRGKDPFPKTTVWGYGNAADPKTGPGANATFSYPSRTIEAKVDKPVRVKWINDLKDSNGNYLKHLLPVDQTLHWANPGHLDCMNESNTVPCQQLYTGPVPIVTHLHGAHVGPDSDGYPGAWYLPAAGNIPANYDIRGSKSGVMPAGDGAALYEYPNDQRATTLWYHDHTLGMTRVNVYAGPAGFYLLRGGNSDLTNGELPSGKYEIPLVIQDRAFNADGSLFYPDNRAYFEGLTIDQLQIPFIPEMTLLNQMSDVHPIHNPEFFGDTIVVNGKTWPYHNVEPRKYRLRLLNASDSRFFILTFNKPLSFWQIGADGGFLPAPVSQTKLLIGPAERADVIVDFSAFTPGTRITLQNVGPDEPFGGGDPGVDFDPANPNTTGKVLEFRVVKPGPKDTSDNPATLVLPYAERLGPVNSTRKVSLNEEESQTVFFTVDTNGNLVESTDPTAAAFGPTEALLGSLGTDGNPIPLEFDAPITENPALNSTEVWEIYNFTADAHPIHIHLVQFEIVNREKLVTDADGMSVKPAILCADKPGSCMKRKPFVRGPEPWETGTKDTVVVYPGELARVKAKFDKSGLFIWHCHILSHEDNEMMRPYCVGGGCN